MIDAGQCLCHVCGRTSSRAYYYGGTGRNGAILMRKSGKYYLAPAVAGNHDLSQLGAEQYVLSDFAGLETGLPNKIEVINRQNGDALTMYRCCPECNNIRTNLFRNYGLAPMYSVAIVGATGSGKTAWLTALGASTNQDLVNKAGYPYRIDLQSTPETDIVRPTDPGSTGKTRYLTIEQGKNVCAGVLLRDYGGELFNGTAQTSTAQNRLLSQADAYLLFADGSAKSRNDFIHAWNAVDEVRNNDRSKPVGVVISHADKMMDARVTSSIVEENGKKTSLLLLTDDTFRQNGSYQWEDLTQRMELEDLIADLYTNRQLSVIKESCNAAKGFIVKSCVNINDKTAEYAGNGINVYDPLLWVLNKLKIFPWG